MQNNLFFEMFPLIAFFTVYYFTKNIYLATGVCILASWAQLFLCKIKYNHISRNTWISTILITVFGGMTILFHNKTFVMLKPTVLLWIIGISMLIGQAAGKNGLKLMLGKELALPENSWKRINLAWGVFFLLMGGVNLYVAMNFSEYTWVKFKVFGTFGLTIAFMLLTVTYILLKRKKQ